MESNEQNNKQSRNRLRDTKRLTVTRAVGVWDLGEKVKELSKNQKKKIRHRQQHGDY